MNELAFIIIGVLVFLALLTLGVFVARAIVRAQWILPKDFHNVSLLVRVPKESRSDDDQRKDSQEALKEMIAHSESFYANLGGLKPHSGWNAWLYGRHDHVAFELVADTEGLISFYVSTPRYMRVFIEQQIQAQFPDADIQEAEDFNIFQPNSVVRAAELKLAREYIFPIETYRDMDSDPLNALTNALSQFTADEGGVIQILGRSAKKSWHNLGAKVAREMQQGTSIERAIRIARGGLFAPKSAAKQKDGGLVSDFRQYGLQQSPKDQDQMRGQYQLSPLEQEIVQSISEKTSRAGFDVNIRVVVAAESDLRADQLLDNILNSFAQFAGYESKNAFKAVKKRKPRNVVNQVIHRVFNEKDSFVLSTTEMTSLYHLPLPTTETPNIRWLLARKAPPPSNMPRDGIVLGFSEYRGKTVDVRIKRGDRRRHVYMIGKSGSGKTVLLQNMAMQDVMNGEGVCIVDPHGDFADDVLAHVPPERAEDVIYFDPSDVERPMGLNMLEFDNAEEMDFVVQEMIQIFYKLFPPEMIGPVFEHQMRNVMLTLMEDRENPGTIAEIPRMFTDEQFQKYKLSKVKDPVVRAFWEKEMAKTSDFHKSETLGYLISKVGRFVENAMMRNIIGQPKSGFNIKDVMDNQKILIVNLSKGKVGEVNSSLLGLIIVSKLQMAALARARMPEEERKDFYLYIDEFQNFVTDSIATILSEARKYKLNLTIAHQYISQLVENNDTQIRDAVLGNAGTMISYRIGVEDAEIIAKEFAPVFSEYDVINVEKHTVYIKMLIDSTASKAFNMRTYPPTTGNLALAQHLKELSRLKFCQQRTQIEAEILERTQIAEISSKIERPLTETTR